MVRAFGIILGFLVLQLGVVQFSEAAVQNFKTEKGEFSFDIKENWQEARDLYGIPVTLMGPWQNEEDGRPVVLVTPVGKNEISFDSKELKKTEKDYREGREAWISKYSDGKIHQFFPYKNEKWSNQDVHWIGHRYTVQQTEYIENSFYVTCGDQLYHLKSLVNAKHSKLNSDTIEMVKSFKCKGNG